MVFSPMTALGTIGAPGHVSRFAPPRANDVIEIISMGMRMKSALRKRKT